MAYYTGQATDYQHLANLLIEKCQQNGWTWQDGILSKGTMFVKLDVRLINEYISGVYYATGLIIEGGTGKNGSQLINPSLNPVRMGITYYSTKSMPNIFPVIYHFFLFEKEVYAFLKFDNNKFYYLAFGQSDLVSSSTANGLWISATSCVNPRGSRETDDIVIGTTSGGQGGTYNATAVAPFWNRSNFDLKWSNSVICHGIDNVLWSSGKSRAYSMFEPLINRMPTANFSDSPLLPYNIFLERSQNKRSLIAQFYNARFVRIDNYEPEQIITLGHEKWMVFPFFQKNIQQRDGGGTGTHTGTLGWAIRYDG